MSNPTPPRDPATFTRRARTAQIIEMAVELVAEKGYAGVTLAGIAERAGISKPAVLYHFSSKAAVVTAAYEHVLGELVAHVGAAVEAAAPEDGPTAYARAMIGHLAAHPRHARMIIEALTNQEGERDSAARWRPLAQIVDAARRARGLAPDPQVRTTALVIGGAVDAVVTEKLHDPAYDTDAAAERLAAYIEAAYAVGPD